MPPQPQRRSPQHGFRRAGALATLIFTAGALTACSDEAPVPDPAASPTSSAVTVRATGLEAPWSIAFHKGTPLISERDSSRIIELGEDRTYREVATIEGVAARGEGGLLGIAIHDGYLYAYASTANDNRISRFLLTGDAGSLQLGPPELILDGIPVASFHNGGRIAFGPDGMLYATVGDAGNPASAQDLDSLTGKILRLTPDAVAPDDNPFPGSLIYSYGHRNPQGIAWDDGGTMYSSEFGQNTWDELNVIEAGGNYGWPVFEGAGNDPDYIDPVQQWPPSEASPSGMAISDGTIYIANLRGARIIEVPLRDLGTSTDLFVGEYGRLRDVVNAPDGSLWILTNNTDGRGGPGPDDDRVLRFEP